MPSAAFAQSTGSVDFEETIVVTGARSQDVDGFKIPDTTKPKQVLEQEVLARQQPGQTPLDAANLVPGVSFTSNDAYGGSGGEVIIRGFSDSRVSVTFDGIPTNDSGNYEVYTSQQLDGELIEQVNVNLGTTDVDSPTASAVGGTVNYRSRDPFKEFSLRTVQSVGEDNFYRGFVVVDSGEFTSFGTRAYAAASMTNYDNPYNNYGKVDREQYNAKIFQPIGMNGDFVSVSGNYNSIRNNFFGSVGLRYDRDVTGGFPKTRDEREYDINYPCLTDFAEAGVADKSNSCGTEFDRRYNPADTGNIRGAMRFTLAEGLVLTVDPSYQFVKANGGGTRRAYEYLNSDGLTGSFDETAYFGVDLNGDGDTLDEVNLLTPSQTRTNRYAVISGLRYDVNDFHTVRVSFTYDHADHRQTGEFGTLEANGEPTNVFPVDLGGGLTDVYGNALRKRDRQSYSVLTQIAAEWRGEFGDLTVNVGARAPFFKRDLENYCFAESASGDVDCFSGDTALEAEYAALNPDTQGPQRRVLKYDDILPNVGAVYDFTNNLSGFVSYARSISVPSTDSLYSAFYFPADTAEAKPDPEITDTFDLGMRYRSSKVQAQLAGWYTKFSNRFAVSYDPELDERIFRNLGRVDKWGVDASVAYAPIKELTFYAFGSLYESEIKDDVQTGEDKLGNPIFAPTAGKTEGGAPTHMVGGSVVTKFGDWQAGITGKRTGGRYLYDTNEPYPGRHPAKTQAYTTVDAHVRYNLDNVVDGMKDSFLQLNVVNMFDKLYVGSFGARLSPADSSPFAQIGTPRTVSLTLSMGI
nr:TonB-dependent receptor [Sphingomicrobium nitratireducens]